ncbi:hypothetical protein BDV10DRAFT_188028 [Aspergillus recurvatus]
MHVAMAFAAALALLPSVPALPNMYIVQDSFQHARSKSSGCLQACFSEPAACPGNMDATLTVRRNRLINNASHCSSRTALIHSL